MNTNSVLHEPDGKTNRLIKAFHEAAPHLPLEGHVPKIVGDDLAEYMLSGVDSDHTEHPLSEFIERWINGFCVQLQDKTVQPDIIQYLNEYELFPNTCFMKEFSTIFLERLSISDWISKTRFIAAHIRQR